MKRRNAMQLVVIGAAAPLGAAQEAPHVHTPAVPAGAANAAGKLQFFTPAQNELVDRLSEMIIPADSHSPGAHDAGVAAFIDGVVAESGAEQKRAWTGGLEAVEAESSRRYGQPFLAATAAQRDELLKDMADGEESPKTELHRFFVMMKRQTLSGYYTSSIGLLKELEYKGIVPIAAYPPCDHPEHKKPRSKK